MWNPIDFPSLPEQYSHGLHVRVGRNGSVSAVPYSTGTGMTVWAETDVDVEGKPIIRFPFSIPGL